MTLQPPPRDGVVPTARTRSSHTSQDAKSSASRTLGRAVGVTGTGSCIPERILSNADLEKLVDTTDDWIVSRTGMRERRIAADGQATSDLATIAGRQALEAAGVDADQVELVVVATASPDHICCPPTSCLVQEQLGAHRAAAFDVSSACTSFVSALSTAQAMVACGRVENALVIGAEKLSSLIDYEDRESCVLFGDGAGALFLQPSQQGGEILDMTLGADGSGAHMIRVMAGGSRMPATHETIDAKLGTVRLEGRAVFKFAVSTIHSVVDDLLSRNGFTLDDLDLFVPHQANLRIIQAAADRLGLPMERVITTVERYGNTSSASIPAAMDEAVRSGRLERGDLTALVAFGGGLTWGGALIRW